MPPQEPTNLLRVFDFYLAMMFVISLVRRREVYWNALRLMVAVRGRWPRLINRLAEHQSSLLDWPFFRPVITALCLTVVQMVCSRLIWPHAVITADELRGDWWLATAIVA